nr:LysR substrate-binding domain-containing protein [Mesorhizobium sp. 1M-11]
MVCSFLGQHPRVTASMVLLDRVVNLVEEGIDVAVRIGSLPDSNLIAKRIGTVRRVLVASPDYLARRGTPTASADFETSFGDCLHRPDAQSRMALQRTRSG